jgi:hypothetical protein
MRTLDHSRPHTTTTNPPRRRSVRNDHIPARHPSAQLMADAVIAGYIHDISRGSRRSVRSTQNRLPRPRPD